MKKLFILTVTITLLFTTTAFALDTSDNKQFTKEEIDFLYDMAKEIANFVLADKNMAETIKNNALAFYTFVYSGSNLNITKGCFNLTPNCSGNRDKERIIELFNDEGWQKSLVNEYTDLHWRNKNFDKLTSFFTTRLAIENAKLHYRMLKKECHKLSLKKDDKEFCSFDMVRNFMRGYRRFFTNDFGEKKYFMHHFLDAYYYRISETETFVNFLNIFTRVKIPYDISDVSSGCKWNITQVTLHGLNVTTMQQYLKIHKGEGIAKTFSYDTLIPFFNWFLCYGGVVDQEDMTGAIRYLGGMIRRGYYRAFANYYERFVREYLDVINRH